MYMERKSTLKIRSISDVITNSSDEVYAVKTQLTPEEVEKKWNEFLESCNGKPGEDYGTQDNPNWVGVYDATIKEPIPGIITIDYPVLCNVENFKSKLEELFGKEQVIDEVESDYWGEINVEKLRRRLQYQKDSEAWK